MSFATKTFLRNPRFFNSTSAFSRRLHSINQRRQTAKMATMAAFRVPNVSNEPNVSGLIKELFCSPVQS